MLCPKCHSSNVQIRREKQGEIRWKRFTTIIRTEVGFCRNCGYTWNAKNSQSAGKNGNTWLWVLGWILFFPIPLTILLVRNDKMKPVVKYSLVALMWIMIIIMGMGPRSTSGARETETKNLSFTITSGTMGEYGFRNTLNAGTVFEETKVVYHIPAGTYEVSNIGKYTVQICAYSDNTRITSEGWKEPAKTGNVAVLKTNETVNFSIENGYYLEINGDGELKF